MTFSITLDSKDLKDFAGCIAKSIKRPTYIYFTVKDKHLYLCSKAYDASVFFVVESEQSSEVRIGVNASEFISAMSKLNRDELTLNISKKKVEMVIGNVTISYATVAADGVDTELPYVGEGLGSEGLSWFMNSLVMCSQSIESIVKDDIRFQDVLLSSEGFAYMTRFTETAVAVSASAAMNFTGRVVIPSSAAKMVKAFKSSINKCIIGSKTVTFILERAEGIHASTIRVDFPFMEDNYPVDCLSFLHLNSSLPLISQDSGYHFQRDHLLQALDLLSSIVKDESQVKFEIIGDQDNEDLVWRLSAISVKGTYCEELVASTKGLKIESFFLHGKKTIKALESYGEEVVFYNHTQSIIALVGDNGNDLILLSKGAR
jgi:hypothetical protein